MGDVIEVTTWVMDRPLFYKFNGNSLYFDVKGSCNAMICLANAEKIDMDCKIVIGENGYSTITVDSESDGRPTRDILSVHEYRRFWIMWVDGMIMLGQNDNPVPLMKMKHSIKVVGFALSVFNHHSSLSWRFVLPPIRNLLPRLKTLSNGNPHWVPANDEIPDEAIIGGHESEHLYIIRASHNNSLTPGKFVPSKGVGYIPWGGEAKEKTEFEVLCGYNCIWVEATVDTIPIGAVVAGYTEHHHETLYVGRVHYSGHLIPGKIHPSHRCCYIPYETWDVSSDSFEVLVVPCSNEKYISPYLFDTSRDSEN